MGYYYKNRSEILANRKIKYQENRESENERSRIYYENNKESISERKSIYNKNNRELNNKTHKRYRENNPHVIAWRSVLKSTIKVMHLTKTEHTIDMLGYSAEDLKQHIESLFYGDITWDNYGEHWHIDHKIPISIFPKNTPINIVNSLENLQPLLANDNLSKGNEILEEYQDMEIYIKYCLLD